MNTFCPQCMKESDVRVEARREVLPVRGEDVEVAAQVAVCAVCGQDVWLDGLEEETLRQAYAEYRRRHGLLQPNEMEQIRRRWGLGQRAFARLLGWGEITLHRYEAGSLQDSAHDAQLRMAASADNIRVLLSAHGERLTPRQRETVERRLTESAAVPSHGAGEDEELDRLLSSRAGGEFGGHVPVSLIKVRELIAFFTSLPDMYATKLAKLMFYADFEHYREYTTSITGLAYAHAPRGPIPDKYERIRDDAEENGIVEIEERLGDVWSGEVLVARRSADLSVFNAGETAVMRAVAEHLGSKTSRVLSELTHAEAAWTETTNGARIPYTLARRLKSPSGAPGP